MVDLTRLAPGPVGPLAGMEYVRARGEQGMQRGQQNALSRLAGKAYGASAAARPAIFGQMAQVSPQAAMDAEQSFDQRDDSVRARLANKAKMLLGMHKAGQLQAVGPLYTSLVQDARRLGFGEVPEQWDDSYIPGMEQMATWNSQGSSPTGWREFELKAEAAGYEKGTPEYQQAARIALGSEGRASSAGYSFYTIDIGDGRKRPARMNPRTGAQEYYDENSQQWTSLGGAGQGGEPIQPGGYYAGSGPNRVNVNLEGISPDRQQQLANVASAMQAAGYSEEAIMSLISQATDADASAAGFSAPSRPTAPRGAGASRTKEEEEAAVRDAQKRVDLSYAGAEANAAAEAARKKKEAEVQGEFNANAPKRQERYQQAMTAAANVQTALNSALDLVGPQSTGFMGARMRGVEGSPAYNLAAQIETVKANLGFDRLQQMRDASPTGGALGAIAIQELIALQSTIANLDPNQSETQLRNNLLRIQEHYRNWTVAVQQAMQQEQAGGNGPRDERREALLDKY